MNNEMDEKKEKNFEEALSRLEMVVQELENGRVSLERAMQLYAEGVELVQLCRKKLEKAEQQILVLTEDNAGRPVFGDCNSVNKGSGVEG